VRFSIEYSICKLEYFEPWIGLLFQTLRLFDENIRYHLQNYTMALYNKPNM